MSAIAQDSVLRCSAACAVAAIASAQSEACLATPGRVEYVVQAGATPHDVAANCLRDPSDWSMLHHLGRVAAARRLQPGTELLLKDVRQAARIIATSGPVDHAYRRNVVVPVAVGMTPGEGDQLCDGHGRFITLELKAVHPFLCKVTA